MTFRRIATLEAGIFALLFALYGFAPGLLLTDWGVALTGDVEFISHRVASAMGGTSVLLWCARDVTDPAARRAIGIGVAVMLALVAMFGIAGFLQNVVGPGIWMAICFELAMAALLLLSLKRD